MEETTDFQRAPLPGALVYLLSAPSDDEVRYVGQTLDARKRLSAHVLSGRRHLEWLQRREASPQLPLAFPDPEYGNVNRVARVGDAHSLPEWLAGLHVVGVRPHMRIIEVLDCRGSCVCTRVSECRLAADREAYWILRYQRIGHRLLNRVLPSRDALAL
jgi:hypothetical protein